MTWSWVPLASLLLFVALVVARMRIHVHRTGKSGNAYIRAKDRRSLAQGIAGGLFLVAVLVESIAAATGELAVAPSTAARAIGTALAFGGSLLMFAAQMNLGASWRIGIEEGARPGLVTSGWYRLCRNPIFLFLLATFAGIALLLWNVPTAVMWLGVLIGVRLQVLEEERWLLHTYGDEYRRYASEVGRFVPGIGRLRK